MKHLLKNLAATKGRFRLRADVGAEDGLTGTTKEGTGGLKLMTVFIAVLGLHILVIGGITIYHFIKGPAKDAAQSEASAPEAVSPDGAADKTATADANGAATPADGSAATPAPGDATTDANGASAPAVQTADGSAPATPAQAQASMPTVKAPVAMPSPVPPAPVTMASAPAPAISGGAPYVVKSGDTLHKIAAAHGMTVAKIKEANGLKSDMLHIGQKLVLGAPASAPVMASAAPAMAQAAAPATAPAPVAAVPAAAPLAAAVPAHSYTVVKGDTLTKIAKTFGTSPAAILAANKATLSDPKKLKIGQALTIPGKADRHEVSEQKVAPSTLQPQANPDLVMNK